MPAHAQARPSAVSSEPTVRPAYPAVDARAARSAQALVAVLVSAAAAAADWRLLAVPALHLALAAALGRRGNLPVRAFDAWIRPRLGAPEWEDARPPRFASTVGAIFLAASLLAHALGQHVLGWALAAAVGALAAIAAATGLCVGCKLYWVVALVRRARLRSIS
jgi:Domain of unknown function (DUF4395)